MITFFRQKPMHHLYQTDLWDHTWCRHSDLRYLRGFITSSRLHTMNAAPKNNNSSRSHPSIITHTG